MPFRDISACCLYSPLTYPTHVLSHWAYAIIFFFIVTSHRQTYWVILCKKQSGCNATFRDFLYLCTQTASCSRRREAFHAFSRWEGLPRRGCGWELVSWHKRRLLYALFLTDWNFANFMDCHEHGNGRCPRDVHIHIPLPLMAYCVLRYATYWYRGKCIHIGVGFDVVLALYQRCTLKDDISYLLPTWLSVGTRKRKRKHHFVGWQERTNKMKNKSCATNFATQQPFSLLLLLQEPFLLAERKKMCYLSMTANQSQYTNINSFILGYIY